MDINTGGSPQVMQNPTIYLWSIEVGLGSLGKAGIIVRSISLLASPIVFFQNECNQGYPLEGNYMFIIGP